MLGDRDCTPGRLSTMGRRKDDDHDPYDDESDVDDYMSGLTLKGASATKPKGTGDNCQS